MPKDAEQNTAVAFDSKYNASVPIEEDGSILGKTLILSFLFSSALHKCIALLKLSNQVIRQGQKGR